MDKIDNLDKKILSILSKNARIPFKDVAAECGVSRAAQVFVNEVIKSILCHIRLQMLVQEANLILSLGIRIRNSQQFQHNSSWLRTEPLLNFYFILF